MDATPVFNRAVQGIDRAILTLAAIMLVVMMLHISLDVLANLLLNSPIPLTSAFVTQYYMIAVAYLPLAAGELRGMHIRVNLIMDHLPPVLRRNIDHLMQLICMVVYGSLALQAWQLAMQKLAGGAFLMEQTTRVTTWPSYLIIPFGFALITLLLGLRLVCRLLGKPERLSVPLTLTTDESTSQ